MDIHDYSNSFKIKQQKNILGAETKYYSKYVEDNFKLFLIKML